MREYGHKGWRKRFLWALAALQIAPAAHAQTVALAEGRVSGAPDGEDVSVFWGIHYASAPVGDLRWAPPVPPAPWGDTVRPADRMPASCPQELTPGGFMMWTVEYITPAEPGVSEDCLVANVWTPRVPEGAEAQGGLPVLVYIHGGGYTSGSGTVPIYNGANLARQGLVVVTINYRLGALGFMAHPELSAEQGGASGNYAIQDQIEALRWVQRNIAAFGGDPAKVTISGQSAGGGSVLALLASPLASGLFRAAIVQSAPGMGSYPPLEAAERSGKALVDGWGVASIAEARALPLDRLKTPPGPGGSGAPIADGRVIPAASGPRPLASDVPIMTGYTLNDLFAPTRRLTSAEWRMEARERYGEQAEAFLRHYSGRTDVEASDSATREAAARGQMAPIVDWLAATGIRSPVYAYLFSHVEPGPDAEQYGAFHSSELPYMFDTLHLSPGRDFTDVDRRVVAQFSGAVVDFVKTGSPAGAAAWPALTDEGKAVMEFGSYARLSRIYPEGADALIAGGKPLAAQPMFGPPPES